MRAKLPDSCYFARNVCSEEIASALDIINALVDTEDLLNATDVATILELLQQLQPIANSSYTTSRNESSNATETVNEDVNVNPNHNSTRAEEQDVRRNIVNTTLDIINGLLEINDPLLLEQNNSAKYARSPLLSCPTDIPARS